MKILCLFFFTIFLYTNNSLAQFHIADEPRDLYRIEQSVRAGNKDSLLKLCAFAGDTIMVNDPLGYHLNITSKSSVVYRIFSENTLFLDQELNLEDSLIRTNFNNRVQNLYDKIYFDKRINAFLITPLENRNVTFEIRAIPEFKLNELQKHRDSILYKNWKTNPQVIKALDKHKPEALAMIASEMLKNRFRWNESDFNIGRYLDAIALLTETAIGVDDGTNTIAYNFQGQFGTTIRLNYAIYWLTHFQNYTWNSKAGFFENKTQKVQNFSQQYIWYQQLNDPKESIAIEAMVHLTEIDPTMVISLSREFDDFKRNFIINSFYQKFLLQATQLTTYCREHNFDYKGSAKLQNDISFLRREHSSFDLRYAKENELIKSLNFYETTALEYWCIVIDDWQLHLSVGRILDKFYSKNWTTIIHDEKMMSLYLKKAILYDRLGIIGSCNYYLYKFLNANAETLAILKKLNRTTKDVDIKDAVSQIVTNKYFYDLDQERKRDADRIAEYRSETSDFWPDNMIHPPVIVNYEDSFQKICYTSLKKEEKKEKILNIAELATYQQLGIALHYLFKTVHSDKYNKLWYENGLIKDHFGIPIDYLRNRKDLHEFLKRYNSLDEISLYKFYLNKAGISIYLPNGNLDYEKIYDILKYNLVVPFVGGNPQQKGIFAVTRILENQFGTSLDLPKKNQHSREFNIIHSFTNDRREKWMDFLVKQKLVTIPKTDIPSFFDHERH